MRHRLHSLCPYFAMFPETFVEKHLCLLPENGVVLDPFSGRGTTIFQSLLSGRSGLAVDTNPLAVCISRAKSDVPTYTEIEDRINQIENTFTKIDSALYEDSFFSSCFHSETLSQVLWLRSRLEWRSHKADCFLAAMAASCLHGESHKSARVFSNRMPRTISTKPAYSVRWWNERGEIAPRRDVFRILRQELDFRFASQRPAKSGVVVEGDARNASLMLKEWTETVDLVVTSPPYLDVTHFREDQWLRVWFLGGEPFPCSAGFGDDRHWTEKSYWRFLSEAWKGIAPLMKKHARIVIRIGGKKVNEESAQSGLKESLAHAFGRVECRSFSTSQIKKGQLRTFGPKNQGTRREFDAVFDVS